MLKYLKCENYNILLKRVLLFIFVFSIGFISNLSGFYILPVVSIPVYASDPVIYYDRIEQNELRGVWIASVGNINFPSKTGLSADEMKSELDDIIKTCKEANLNAIFFQVRPTGDALYDSSIFPTSKYLTGKQGDKFTEGFDPLKYIIQAAHTNNIELHAWINPYRITLGSAAYPEHDLNALSQTNPARLNPSWVVAHTDGKLYYNPGLPEVRRLITNGVMEIVNNYNIDGIHFDDYFYPSDNTDKFDDSEAYKKYGSGRSLADFRRDSVNEFVRGVYDAIKKANPSVRFGISPSGIWANASTTAGGSDTAGFESYHRIYADSKAWINGGYIDYICPQIYWAFNTNIARYDKLVRWWSSVVDGTGVDLYIGHAAYKLTTDFKSESEIPRQVEYARNYMGVTGSIFYGYVNIAANDYKIKDNLARIFEKNLLITSPADNGKGIAVRRPVNGDNTALSAVNLSGNSNPLFPVYYNGEKIPRTKNGFFMLSLVPLKSGKNNIILTQNNSSYTHVIYSGTTYGSASPTQMNAYNLEINSYTTDNYAIDQLNGNAHNQLKEIFVPPGDKIIIHVWAPSNSEVTAKLGGSIVILEPLNKPADEGAYMLESYRGTIHIPQTQPQGELIDLGNIVITAKRGLEEASLTGLKVKLINESVYKPQKAAEVINDYSHIKISPTSSFYNDYLPASIGMRDNITGYENGYYQLGFGGWIAAENVVLLPEKTLLINRIFSATLENIGKSTEIRFAVTENIPVDAKCKDGVFSITLFNTPSGAANLVITDNPIFKSARVAFDKDKKTATYTLDLIHEDNFYGFEVYYEGGFIIFKVKNPMKKSQDDLPLKDLTIVIDPGHGGTDTGALGFIKGKDEKDLNLDISLSLRTVLTNLGANVIMTRETDATLRINKRMDILNETNADLVISIHHNSVGDPDSNGNPREIWSIRGFESRYCNESGRLLAKITSNTVTKALSRVERNTLYQALAVLRNHKFPATLLEMSFMTTPEDFEFTFTTEGVQRSADAIADSVIAWIAAQEKWVK